jgi:hypothetical protein
LRYFFKFSLIIDDIDSLLCYLNHNNIYFIEQSTSGLVWNKKGMWQK